MKTLAIALAALAALGAIGELSPTRRNPAAECRNLQPVQTPPFHDHPSKSPLPPTLNPEQFKDSRDAFVAYSVASRISELLYQEPCYCPCKNTAGHESLLDCFTSTHGKVCVTCRKEVLLCMRLFRRGATPEQIRNELEKRTFYDIDEAQEDKRIESQRSSSPEPAN